jgi:hypothetical protein
VLGVGCWVLERSCAVGADCNLPAALPGRSVRTHRPLPHHSSPRPPSIAQASGRDAAYRLRVALRRRGAACRSLSGSPRTGFPGTHLVRSNRLNRRGCCERNGSGQRLPYTSIMPTAPDHPVCGTPKPATGCRRYIQTENTKRSAARRWGVPPCRIRGSTPGRMAMPRYRSSVPDGQPPERDK